MTTGSEITAAGFKTIQDKAESLLGVGSGSRGYGQTVQSADYSPGTAITKEQWDLLKNDIINIRTHQDGSTPPIIQINAGDVIRFGVTSPNTNYNSLLETAIANRFNIGPGRSIVSAISTQSTNSTWSNSVSCVITATFSNSNQARYFFNSGGKLRISASRTGGLSNAQNNFWTNLLASVGIREFGAATDPFVNFYTLTNSYQIFYQNSSSSPYAANRYRLEAKCNVSNNSTGTANVVDIRVTLVDGYVDPGNTLYDIPNTGDAVTGTLTIIVDELKASGQLVPAGIFTITSPTYSVSAIAVS
jgi:hypothetical protein